ncbi:MAG: PhoH family protein [Gracilibacteraceae bacterium]|nr:PhoH family protein [Gracilibacteraceae bacterium]
MLEEFRVKLQNEQEAMILFGLEDAHLRLMEEKTKCRFVARGTEIVVTGESDRVERAAAVLDELQKLIRAGNTLTPSDVLYVVSGPEADSREGREHMIASLTKVIATTQRGRPIKAKTIGQDRYIKSIDHESIVFGIGPAGTGKTYLAVVMAVKALKNKEVNRIVLTRPAVEAGEKLGFLPGDLQEKVNPYLRPLYDALFDLLGPETTARYLEKGAIEIAPLAYMRGRTLDDSFVILDEAQNTSPEQMKMFLTRLGYGSKAVVTGDITQTDLPRGQYSGLVEVQRVLTGIADISFHYFTARDVVRNPLVQSIINAYETEESRPKTGA